MSRLDQALDDWDGEDVVEVELPAGRAEVEAAEVGPVGVRLRRLRVERERDVDVAREAERLSDGLRSLGERVVPTEVDPRLRGATLRTHPDEMREREFFQVDLDAEGAVEVGRTRVTDEGRRDVDWSMTRDQLGRLLDELG